MRLWLEWAVVLILLFLVFLQRLFSPPRRSRVQSSPSASLPTGRNPSTQTIHPASVHRFRLSGYRLNARLGQPGPESREHGLFQVSPIRLCSFSRTNVVGLPHAHILLSTHRRPRHRRPPNGKVLPFQLREFHPEETEARTHHKIQPHSQRQVGASSPQVPS